MAQSKEAIFAFAQREREAVEGEGTPGIQPALVEAQRGASNRKDQGCVVIMHILRGSLVLV